VTLPPEAGRKAALAAPWSASAARFG